AMVIASALLGGEPIVFRAWVDPFEESLTEDAPFFRLDGAQVEVPLMQVTMDRARYARGEDYQALELPYVGGDFVMLVILPDEGAYAAVDERLDAAFFAEVRESVAAESDIQVFLPRFELTYSASLGDTLRAMGMELPFTDAADFGGMVQPDAGGSINISEVVHKAFVAVDESGTEAAAATAMVIASALLGGEPIVFRADRPFMFSIVDRVTGSVLFLGSMVDPTPGTDE
ncbi:MAG: serpin family protein, partial [Chloroflexota bacterium]